MTSSHRSRQSVFGPLGLLLLILLSHDIHSQSTWSVLPPQSNGSNTAFGQTNVLAEQDTGQSNHSWKPVSCPISDTLVDSIYFGKFNDTNNIIYGFRYFRNRDTLFLLVHTYDKDPIFPTFVCCKDTISLLTINSFKHNDIDELPFSNLIYVFRMRRYRDITFRIQLLNFYTEITFNPYKIKEKLPSTISFDKNK